MSVNKDVLDTTSLSKTVVGVITQEVPYDFIRPQHYSLWEDNNDTFHIIESSLTREEYIGFLKGNILKYQLRLGKKPGESIAKDQEKINYYREKYNLFKQKENAKS